MGLSSMKISLFLITIINLTAGSAFANDFGNIMTDRDSWVPYGCSSSYQEDCEGRAQGTMGRERKTWTYFCKDSNSAIQRKELTCTSRIMVQAPFISIWHGGHEAKEGKRFCFNDQAHFFLQSQGSALQFLKTGYFMEEYQGPYNRPYYQCKLMEGVNPLFKNVSPAPGENVVAYEIILEDGRKSKGQFTLDLKEIPTTDVYSGPVLDHADELCSAELEERICRFSWSY